MQVTQADLDAAARARTMINPAGEEARERAKFEQHSSYLTSVFPVGNPYAYRPFPKNLFRALRHPRLGRLMCLESAPDSRFFASRDEYAAAAAVAEQFSKDCQKEVQDEREYQQAMEAGWRESPGEALEHAEGREKAVSTAAAERHYTDLKMSDGAQREALAQEMAAAPFHLPSVPEAPVVKRRGRPRKAATKVGAPAEG